MLKSGGDHTCPLRDRRRVIERYKKKKKGIESKDRKESRFTHNHVPVSRETLWKVPSSFPMRMCTKPSLDRCPASLELWS